VQTDNIVKLIQPGAVSDPLTGILRNGARALLVHAVEAEVADFLAKHGDLKTEDGRQRVVRHGHLPEREVMTGIGPVAVRQPRVRDREAGAEDPERIRFTPAILPPYARRSKSLDSSRFVVHIRFASEPRREIDAAKGLEISRDGAIEGPSDQSSSGIQLDHSR
jgi:putative transposase